MRLYIHTLGDFDISFKEQSLLKELSRSYKLFKLFEYFITFRGRKLLPETIIENLWQNNEYSDPKNVLRTQIFRLRQIYKKIIPEGIDESKYFTINFSNGYYCFELGEYAILDIEEFEEFIEQGDNERFNNIDESVKLYKQVLKLYKGPYLAENSYEAWLVPIRNHYSRLYLKTLFKLIEMLKEKEEYNSIIDLCEEAILIEPYEEAVHIYLIEAMLKVGHIKDAMSHYEYIASLLSKEIGIKSSLGLRNVYRKIQSYYDEKGETNIENIKTKLEESSLKGALLCDSDYFKFLFNLQKRKGLRGDTLDFMSLITLGYEDTKNHSKEDIKKFVKIMSSVLEKSLRKGDVYSFWNDTQILVMLHGAKENCLDEVEKRIIENFKNTAKTDICNINIKFLPLVSGDSIE
jgi:DNA-binding SARP family transcriptional activator